ncbi:cupin domain-containing protein [Burkholderia sp. S-53]|uniref:cupin domain-containing protein n=1 Tax=Burkholderia sp. S-53 TaxID=2906514 RepID=UPI0021CEE75A|nr:cupin domain-containing protein [Burkholderia sp. S-53]UXU87886.1 cupin domain-containing protein [Burkholderia sp. S-53]
MIELNMKASRFVENYLDKHPVLFRDALRNNFLSWDEISEAIYIGESMTQGPRLNKGGFLEESKYIANCGELGQVRRRLEKGILYDELRNGTTLVFNRMELASYKVRLICKSISRFVGEHAVANGYIAFGEDESFGKHWDTHSVFAVQMMGRKRWLIYEPTHALPLKHQRSTGKQSECPAEPYMDVTIETGDILYLPRGWWHTAIPLNEETFHLAVGVHESTVSDYIKYLANEIIGNFDVFRQTIALGEKRDIDLGLVASELARIVEDQNMLANYNDRRRRNFREASKPNLQLHALRSNFQLDKEAKFLANTPIRSVSIDEKINGVQMPVGVDFKKLHKVIFASTGIISYKELRDCTCEISSEEFDSLIVKLLEIDVLELI